MPTWLIEPRDPLIVRDGRPFDTIPGARASSMAFPFPSTTTGAVRTRAGLDASGHFDSGQIGTLKAKLVSGPMLVEVDDTHVIQQWLFPAPADALFLELDPASDSEAVQKPLLPLATLANGSTDLPDGLNLVGPVQPDPRKPTRGPRFWYWESLHQWLRDPQSGIVALSGLGHDGPLQEQRTHVRIRSDTFTAVEGALFQTRGLEFARPSGQRLALAVTTDAVLKEGMAPLGGERRLVNWRSSQKGPPGCPVDVRDSITHHRACRIILVSPAHFTNGHRPDWLLQARYGVTPTLVGMALPRYQVVSGWDLEKRQPKPTRRLVPAGSVLFLSLDGEPAAIETWVENYWMHCVSDLEQDRLDGFGLAILGSWSGQLQEMEWKS